MARHPNDAPANGCPVLQGPGSAGGVSAGKPVVSHPEFAAGSTSAAPRDPASRRRRLARILATGAVRASLARSGLDTESR